MTRRDWSRARQKVNREGRCRLHATHTCKGPLEAAHVIGRRYDEPVEGINELVVHPDDVVPLCQHAHELYDARKLDLLPFLTLAEQARAVSHVGIVRALTRTTGAPQ